MHSTAVIPCHRIREACLSAFLLSYALFVAKPRSLFPVTSVEITEWYVPNRDKYNFTLYRRRRDGSCSPIRSTLSSINKQRQFLETF